MPVVLWIGQLQIQAMSRPGSAPRPAARSVEVNGRTYAFPQRPVVVVCVDGCEPDYLTRAIAASAMPWLERALTHGATQLVAECAMPSFTNPNNLSIVTGAPPAV